MSIEVKYLAVVAAVCVLAGSARADKPKNHRISIDSAAQVGAEVLQPGEYNLAIHSQDAKVVVTRVNSGAEFELVAKVELAGEKAATSEIHWDKTGQIPRLKEIRLGGSRTRVLFE